MQWSEAIREYVDLLSPVVSSEALCRRLYSLIDLTSLNDDDTDATIATLCEKAQSPLGHVAGVCVYPKFIRVVAAQFANSPIKAVAVANFPKGEMALETVMIQIGAALQDGAEEIDVVFPYGRYLAGERQFSIHFVTACKEACGDKAKLKVILEVGALGDPAIIADAAFDAISAGADFIKTSTGKIREGASLDAAAAMLLVIKHVIPKLEKPIGIKISGGIRDIEQATSYVELADRIMGRAWVTPDNFRIGASQLVDKLLTVR
jgi:deoxyribose-phosphate aldolase